MGHATRSRKRDVILYIAIGVSVPVVMMAWVYWVPQRYWLRLTFTWYAFICFTFLMGIFLVKFYWRHRKMVNLWLLLGLLMAIHTTAYVIFLSYVHQWPALWYVFTMPIEIMLFAVVVKKRLDVLPTKYKRF